MNLQLSEDTPDVLHVSKYYYPEVGGIEQVVQTLAEGLNGPSYNTSVLASAPRGRGSVERTNGVPVRKAGSLGEMLSVPMSPLFPIELAAAGYNADILHFHLPHPGAVASQLALGPDAPKIVVTYHSDIVKQSTALKFYRPFLHRFLEQADHIMTTSPNLFEDSEHLAPYAEKCTVVPLSIDLDEFGSYSGETYDIPGEPSRPTLLFVGRLSYYKGVKYLVDAMEHVDADLLIVGDGEQRDALEKRVRDVGAENNVHFLGKIPDEELHYCYDIADVFVLPSIASSEAFGIVQLEAMAYETPVINTSLPTGVPWVSTHEETGLTVPPKDSDTLAVAISRLLEDDELRRAYGRNAATRVQEKFSQERMLERTADVYNRVLSEPE
ncbi:glycosyltransferase [Halogranum amylolyticum]|nr:glycosyltransferase [Halogranum amylolyticum]